MATLYEELGGEDKLRQIISDFVDRVYGDTMIGFFFRGVDPVRIKELEFQHAAVFLGANLRYEGRPLPAAHKKHRIMGGQFARRKRILQEVLAAHGVVAHIASAWLAHTESLRAAVTRDGVGVCAAAES